MCLKNKIASTLGAIALVCSSLEAVVATSKPTQEAWNRVSPYLLPADHPIRDQLDAFFMQSRCTFSEDTFKAAGFSKWKPRLFTRLIVAKHPLFPGYVFKLYYDTQRFYQSEYEWEIWSKRVEGANLVAEEVEAQGWQAYIKTPKKWIYPLPTYPKPPKGYLPKHFILIQEDMDLLSDEDNQAKWKSSEVTFDDLTRVHHIIKKIGLSDCAKIQNAPFAKDGRVAFIDTQTFNQKEITWDSLDKYLSPENKKFWRQLIRQK